MCIKWYNSTFNSHQWCSYGLDFTQRTNVELKHADTEGYVIRSEGGKLEGFYNFRGHL